MIWQMTLYFLTKMNKILSSIFFFWERIANWQWVEYIDRSGQRRDCDSLSISAIPWKKCIYWRTATYTKWHIVPWCKSIHPGLLFFDYSLYTCTLNLFSCSQSGSRVCIHKEDIHTYTSLWLLFYGVSVSWSTSISTSSSAVSGTPKSSAAAPNYVPKRGRLLSLSIQDMYPIDTLPSPLSSLSYDSLGCDYPTSRWDSWTRRLYRLSQWSWLSAL